MGIFNWFNPKKQEVENRSLADYSYTGLGGALVSLFGDDTVVKEDEAMSIPSVVACIELITGSIAQLPIYLYKEDSNREVEEINNDRRVFLLNNEPNPTLNGYNFKKKVAKDYLLYGTSYTKVERERNTVLELHPLNMQNVQVTKYLINGYKYDAEIKLTNYMQDELGKEIKFKPYELVSILKDSEDGITSRGILNSGSDILQLALNENTYSNNILKNGALPIGVLQTDSKLSKEAIGKLRAGWESLYAGARNSGKTVILEEGLKYNPISLRPNDLQLIDGRKATVAEICRLFNVPESMVNADANKYASNEQNNLHFLQYTLLPIITAIESALDKSLLLESEKEEGYYFRFDTTEILRTTEKERIEAAALGLKSGFFSLNETRGKFDKGSLEDDFFMWSLGNVLFNPDTKEMFVPNMQGSGDLDDGPLVDANKQKDTVNKLNNLKGNKKNEEAKDEE